MLKIAMSEISRLFDAIQAVDELYLPVEKGNEVEFGPYSADAKVRLDALQTVKSAKDMFFPFQEDLMTFHMDGKKISVEAWHCRIYGMSRARGNLFLQYLWN